MAGQKILVVYYSRSGTTRRIAQALAGALGCDTEEIRTTQDRSGTMGYWRSAIEARRWTPAAIAPAHKDPAAYDLVIVGTPVWVWSLSSPVRAYLTANRYRLPAVAYFCTLGGAGSDNAFDQMQQLTGQAPRARLAVTAADVAAGRYETSLAAFVAALEPARSAARPAPRAVPAA
ncbi:MAG: flavodoxin [Bradyrhizobium sp.]|nr:flavodoxin [Bradyrhizobium sp.]